MNKSASHSCPVCKHTTIRDKNSYWPFCSERCRLLDLGDWLTEKHYVAGEEQLLDDNFQDIED